MKKSNYGFWAVFRREWYRITHRRIYLLSMVIIPLFASFVLLSIMQKGLPKNMPIAVVDEDNTPISQALIRQLDAMDQSKVVMTTPRFSVARQAMQEERVYAILVIPHRFEADILSGKRPFLQGYTNNAFLMAGGLLYRDMRVICELAIGKVILQSGLAHGKEVQQVMTSIQPIKVSGGAVGNPKLNYSMYLNNNFLPGILQLLILQITAFAISIEIKENTGRELIRISKNNMLNAIMGKLSLHTIIFFIVGLSMLLWLYGIERFSLMNGLLPMVAAMLVFIIASQSLGVLFVTIFPAPRLSLSLSSLFGMLSFSLSAFSFPATSMYPPIRALTYIFPLRYYNIIYIDQALSGKPFAVSAIYYASLLAFMLVALLSMKSLRKELMLVNYIE